MTHDQRPTPTELDSRRVLRGQRADARQEVTILNKGHGGRPIIDIVGPVSREYVSKLGADVYHQRNAYSPPEPDDLTLAAPKSTSRLASMHDKAVQLLFAGGQGLAGNALLKGEDPELAERGLRHLLAKGDLATGEREAVKRTLGQVSLDLQNGR